MIHLSKAAPGGADIAGGCFCSQHVPGGQKKAPRTDNSRSFSYEPAKWGKQSMPWLVSCRPYLKLMWFLLYCFVPAGRSCCRSFLLTVSICWAGGCRRAGAFRQRFLDVCRWSLQIRQFRYRKYKTLARILSERREKSGCARIRRSETLRNLQSCRSFSFQL